MKPQFEIDGQDGNIFSILGEARRILRNAGLSAEVEEMSMRVTRSDSYEEALKIISEYVEYV